MDNFWHLLLTTIAAGGAEAIIVILLVALATVSYVAKKLLDELKKSTEKTLQSKDEDKVIILDIVEKYHQGNLTIVQAINEIKIVLTVIQAKI